MNNLFVFGCSLSAQHPKKYIEWKGENVPKIWPEILSNDLNMNLINLSVSSSSNYSIFRQFISVCDSIEKSDFLIFGWSGLLRYYLVKDNQFMDILPSYFEGVVKKETHEDIIINRSEILWVNEILDYIKLINEFCKKIGVPVYHWTSDDDITKIVYIENSQLQYDLNFIEMDNIKSANMFAYFCEPEFYNGTHIAKIVQETNGEIEDNHLSEFGHNVQANYFYQKITKNFV